MREAAGDLISLQLYLPALNIQVVYNNRIQWMDVSIIEGCKLVVSCFSFVFSLGASSLFLFSFFSFFFSFTRVLQSQLAAYIIVFPFLTFIHDGIRSHRWEAKDASFISVHSVTERTSTDKQKWRWCRLSRSNTPKYSTTSRKLPIDFSWTNCLIL